MCAVIGIGDNIMSKKSGIRKFLIWFIVLVFALGTGMSTLLYFFL